MISLNIIPPLGRNSTNGVSAYVVTHSGDWTPTNGKIFIIYVWFAIINYLLI